MQCPHCSSYELRRSHLRWWDYPLFALLLRPMRCRLCDRRSYQFLIRLPLLG